MFQRLHFNHSGLYEFPLPGHYHLPLLNSFSNNVHVFSSSVVQEEQSGSLGRSQLLSAWFPCHIASASELSKPWFQNSHTNLKYQTSFTWIVLPRLNSFQNLQFQIELLKEGHFFLTSILQICFHIFIFAFKIMLLKGPSLAYQPFAPDCHSEFPETWNSAGSLLQSEIPCLVESRTSEDLILTLRQHQKDTCALTKVNFVNTKRRLKWNHDNPNVTHLAAWQVFYSRNSGTSPIYL